MGLVNTLFLLLLIYLAYSYLSTKEGFVGANVQPVIRSLQQTKDNLQQIAENKWALMWR
jgi:hypothetical protein